MLINKYRHIHINENCSANMLNMPDVIHFLANYKGAQAGQPSQPKTSLIPGPKHCPLYLIYLI